MSHQALVRGWVVVEFNHYKERNMGYMGHPRPIKMKNVTLCHLRRCKVTKIETKKCSKENKKTKSKAASLWVVVRGWVMAGDSPG